MRGGRAVKETEQAYKIQHNKPEGRDVRKVRQTLFVNGLAKVLSDLASKGEI